ncbi:hypothetical protein ACJX0J_014497, partial [Zea mays]
MPATASGGARPEEVLPAPTVSASASSCMGTRAEELTARLAAAGPSPGAGAGGEEVEHERVRALREIKNQIIENRTKKLLYLRLGAVPAVVSALADPGASPAALVQAAAAAGIFACGVEDCARRAGRRHYGAPHSAPRSPRREGNLGNLLLIIVPTVCDEDGNPFGDDSSTCRSRSLSYLSLSMALGCLFIWTHTYSLMQKSGKLYNKMQSKSIQCPADSDEEHEHAKEDGPAGCADEEAPLPTSVKPREHEHGEEEEHQMEAPPLSCESEVADKGFWTKLKDAIHQFIEELMAPRTISAIIGFVVGLVPWLKSLIVGDGAPLKVIQDSLQLMGDGTIPCITLILGGNLTQGLRKSGLKRAVIVAIMCVRFVLLPLIGIAVSAPRYASLTKMKKIEWNN